MIKTKRWNDPREEDDGYRVLVCRYRPRGVSKDKETWDAWLPDLGPSVALHAAVYGKTGPAIAWDEYAARYREEMKTRTFWIRGFAESSARGRTTTLLCSSACADASKCHRSILQHLIEHALDPAPVRAAVHIRRGRLS